MGRALALPMKVPSGEYPVRVIDNIAKTSVQPLGRAVEADSLGRKGGAAGGKGRHLKGGFIAFSGQNIVADGDDAVHQRL